MTKEEQKVYVVFPFDNYGSQTRLLALLASNLCRVFVFNEKAPEIIAQFIVNHIAEFFEAVGWESSWQFLGPLGHIKERGKLENELAEGIKQNKPCCFGIEVYKKEEEETTYSNEKIYFYVVETSVIS